MGKHARARVLPPVRARPFVPRWAALLLAAPLLGAGWAQVCRPYPPTRPNRNAAPRTQSIDALADALEEFEGGVIIISHDARLLSRVCDNAERAEVWIVDNGQVDPYDGDFEDYKDELIKEIARELDED